jgi:hypothetical protein
VLGSDWSASSSPSRVFNWSSVRSEIPPPKLIPDRGFDETVGELT